VLAGVAVLVFVGGVVLTLDLRHQPLHKSGREARIALAVTTTILDSMVHDVAGDAVRTRCLVPPRSCPGHFDLKPGDLEQIAACRAFIRHDYQSHLDQKLRAAAKDARVIVVESQVSQATPEGYLAGCRVVCGRLKELCPASAEMFDARLAETTERVRRVEAELRPQLEPLNGKAVLASQHQKGFCEWAGLKVIATFGQGEDMSFKELSELLDSGRKGGAVAVIGNVQRGSREPRAIAEMLRLPVVILSNFPDPEAGQKGFVDLLRDNCRKLLEGIPHD